ncbi:MAG: 30S ribosomal protein S2 [Anaerolineae bacterium]|jgi:small subunit ribosomal protein S2|nr:30S ribosomal protein S2 [Anaerolineae bacterium]
MPSSLTMKKLLETGVHFGHRTTKWNPRMEEFIFDARNGIHIIDLRKTFTNLNTYYDIVRDIISNGGVVLFVGTKRQAQEAIQREAQRCAMPYVNTRWLGGTLTNWRTIRARIDTLKKMEKALDSGEYQRLTKKEALMNQREIEKLRIRLGGLRDLRKLPELLIVVDTERELTAVKEANSLGIPVLGIVDTNANPDVIDYIIPGNDDAMRSIRLLVSAIADAVLEGKAMRKGSEAVEEEAEEEAPLVDYDDATPDEDLLGTSTLSKLRDSRLLQFEEEQE